MSTNIRDCKSFELTFKAYSYGYKKPLKLCNENMLCKGEEDGDVVTTFPVPIIVSTGDDQKVSVVGHMKVLILPPDSRLGCVVIEAQRIIKCSNCGTSCAPEEFIEDMGCISNGDVLATGDYIFNIPTQFNPAYEDIEHGVIRVVLEPIISEHFNAKLYNVKG